MWDFTTALMGGKHCGWCTDKPNGRIMEHFNGTGPRKEQPLSRQVFWIFMDFNYWLHIWRLGERWHYRYHRQENEPMNAEEHWYAMNDGWVR